MGKLHVAHRIVTRNALDQITRDEPYDDFVQARAAFDTLEAAPGETITMQHGARVIFTKEAALPK
ncbi:hypothetical protein BMI86_10335 [Thioclava sp. DLFJ5-1]|uniref:hypothetical protein n=1 Tax=Thioclava sp. DLFJ5-1 TaxID=1915314 RepID=UPI0009972C86|nr:hypothetical protein [Thioclava sp. DLFJ5-1]OOY20894.1 hypothetical protein BMI86_10335 [Thioclava sp. DLFJ5-1]